MSSDALSKLILRICPPERMGDGARLAAAGVVSERRRSRTWLCHDGVVSPTPGDVALADAPSMTGTGAAGRSVRCWRDELLR